MTAKVHWQNRLRPYAEPFGLDGIWRGAADHPDDSWWVQDGDLDVSLELNETPGLQVPIARLGAGDLLLAAGSVAAGRPDLRFSMSGHARLLRMPTGALIEALLQAGDPDAVQHPLSAWLDKLAAAAPAANRPLHSQVDLHAGEQYDLLAGDSAAPRDGLLWAKLEAGECLLLGREELAMPAGQWLPFSQSLWALVESDQAQLAVMGAGETPPVQAVTEACRWLLAGIAGILASSARLKHAADVAALKARTLRDEKVFGGALRDLAVVTASSGTRTHAPVSADDALLAACGMVGAPLGLKFRAPRSGLPPAAAGESVAAVCRASRVRVRGVRLRGAWWRRDNGPLLAFRKEDGRPVALLPSGKGGYSLVDPVRPEAGVRRVDEAAAASLRNNACMFFAALGDAALSLADLFRVAFRGLGKDIRWLLVASLAVSLAALVAPMATRVLFDEVIPRADRGLLPVVGLFLIVVPLSAALVGLVKNRALLRIQGKTEMNSEAALIDRVLRLPAGFFKQYLAGDLETRLLAVSNVRASLSQSVLSSLLSGLFSFTSLGLVMSYDARLALLGLVLGLISVAVIVAASLLGVRYNRQLMKLNGEIQGLVLQLFSGIAKLRVAAAERRAFAVWGTQFARHKHLAYRFGQLNNAFSLYHAAFPLFTTMLFFAVISSLNGAGPAAEGAGAVGVSNGAYVAALTAFGQFLGGVLGLGTALISIIDIVPELERIRPLLRAVPEDSGELDDPGVLGGHVSVDKVSFRYDPAGPLVLDQVSMDIQRGQMVAIVGPSGSGKSTLARLLLGLETPESGSVSFDGQDLRELDPGAVRHQLGTVLQGSVDLGGTIQDAILGSASDLTADDAWEALRLAAMDEEVRALPMGLNTVLAENWATFSGGQQQRLRLARALVGKPPILILDEATSAVDNRSQEIIRANLEQLGTTRIVIAHRLSTIRQADTIHVLENGVIRESGSYEELMALGGRFFELARRQQL